MSQVGVSRPASQMSQKVGVTLPQIQHPLSRIGNPETLGIRGVSRGENRPASHPNQGRPFANETDYQLRKSVSAAGRESRQSTHRYPAGPLGLSVDSIPEGVVVKYGDPNKTRLPVFGKQRGESRAGSDQLRHSCPGSRAEMGNRADMASRVSSRLSQASGQARLEIDELEALLKQRVQGNYYEVRKRFRDNDPEGKGNVSREALFRIVVTILNRQLSQSQYNRLMDRLGFKDKVVVNYTEFFSLFRQIDDDDDEYPRWMDPVQRHYLDKATMNATQVHVQLKEKAKQRFLDVADLIPQLNPGGTGRILKPEFRQMLNKLMFYMEDDEFEKLWQKYDMDNTGAINGEKFLNKLGISLRQGTSGDAPRLSPIPESEQSSSRRTPRRKEIERKQSLDIERWLKNKFREGCSKMKESFEDKDPERTGEVSFDDFLSVLAQYGLKMEKKLLAAFLSRCSVQARPKGVPYREFLHRFQDRSEAGMTHNILINSKHRLVRLFNADRSNTPGAKSTLSVIETQLMNMFQRDFLALLGTFKSIDKLGTNVISQEEFRAAIESRFNLELTDEQFETFIDRIPLDEDGNVTYGSFMQQFDTRGMAPSLFQGKQGQEKLQKETAKKGQSKAPPPPPVRTTSPVPKRTEQEEVDRLVVVYDEPLEETDAYPRRSTQELFRLIKDLFYRRFQDVEQTFFEIDEINSRRLSQETMYTLLQSFDIQPPVTRGEIRDLWKTFITNTDKTLDYYQFVRHFGYSLRSAAYPNAKMNPPRRGDSDFMVRSRKLNCAADMLQDSLRSKIDYMWEELRKEFVEMDPYRTGYVNKDEFKDVLSELCVQLSDYELNMLSNKFEITKDGRVSYVEFLKPFALRKQVWRHGNNMLSLLQHPQSELPLTEIVEPPQKGLHGITSKLRQTLAGDWKNLRRAFRKLDVSNDGYLTVPEFRSVLKLANVILDEDEVYHVLNQFDKDLTGKIAYEKFIEETFKPPSRQSVKRLG